MKKQDKNLENSGKNDNAKVSGKRRAFLKKAAYSAPVLLALGQLAKPTKIHADGTGGPDGPPIWGTF